MAARSAIHITAAGTQVLVPATSGKSVRVRRALINVSAAGTIDFQDTSGATLAGGPFSLGGTINTMMLSYMDLEDARVNPLFTTAPGLGFQIVTTGAVTFNGFVEYDLQ